MGVCRETSSVLAVDQKLKHKLSCMYTYWTSSPCSPETKSVRVFFSDMQRKRKKNAT